MNGPILFRNRQDAGRQLARQLEKYQNDLDGIVLGLPRGGVPVAYEVATYLHLPLDVFIVRKLGVPDQVELAMGALTHHSVFLNDEIISQLHLTQAEIDSVIEQERAELLRRELIYRGDRPFPIISNKKIILIDDGIATGASIYAAVIALKKLSPKKIIIAVPVAAESILKKMTFEIDEFVCIYPAPIFYGVGQFYEDFSQTTDDIVRDLLKKR